MFRFLTPLQNSQNRYRSDSSLQDQSEVVPAPIRNAPSLPLHSSLGEFETNPSRLSLNPSPPSRRPDFVYASNFGYGEPTNSLERTAAIPAARFAVKGEPRNLVNSSLGGIVVITDKLTESLQETVEQENAALTSLLDALSDVAAAAAHDSKRMSLQKLEKTVAKLSQGLEDIVKFAAENPTNVSRERLEDFVKQITTRVIELSKSLFDLHIELAIKYLSRADSHLSQDASFDQKSRSSIETVLQQLSFGKDLSAFNSLNTADASLQASFDTALSSVIRARSALAPFREELNAEFDFAQRRAQERNQGFDPAQHYVYQLNLLDRVRSDISRLAES
jgi:hypothetical protein